MKKINSFINKIFLVIIIFTVIMGTFNPVVAFAQEGDIKREVNTETGKISFIGPSKGDVLPARQALNTSIRPQDPAMALAERFAPEFGVQNPTRDLYQTKSVTSDEGRITTRFQQTYAGIPVIAGELIVNTNQNGDLYSMNGEVSPTLSLQTDPTIESVQATATALEAIAKWYELSPNDFIATEPELWIFDESLLQPSNRPIELVWRLEVSAVDIANPIRELVLVNASTGSISLHFNQIDNAWHSEKQTNYNDRPILDSDPTTWFVTTTGNDTNDCQTATTPCATIQGAVNKASANDIIYVGQGTYIGDSAIISITKNVSISGGWNSSFNEQLGFSTLDGTGATSSNTIIHASYNTNLERFIVKNRSIGVKISCPTSVNLKQVSINNMTSTGIQNCGTILVENSTIAYNQGIGIKNFTGTVTIKNSTIAFNNAPQSGQFIGGGIDSTQGTVHLQNSILYGNTGYAGQSQDCSGSPISDGNNIIGLTSNCYMTTQSTDLVGIDPKISYLLPNGYIPLSYDSPAIDAGNLLSCLVVDQRNISRPQGGNCDIGSYEYTPAGNVDSLAIVSGDNQHSALTYEFYNPFVVVALDSQGSPVPNINITFIGPSTGASGVFTSTNTNMFSTTSDNNGIATTSIFRANNQTGAYTLIASSNGVPSVNFNLQNSALYVSVTGNDSNSCLLPNQPCATINGAINKATSGDGIFVATGTYTRSGDEVVLINKDIVLSGGWNADFTSRTGTSIVDAEDAYRIGIKVLDTSKNAFIDYFTIQNSSHPSGSIFVAGKNVTISNSNIVSNNTDGIFTYTSNLTVVNSLVANNTGSGISSSGNLEIYNSTISGNLSSSYQDAGLYLGGIVNTRIVKNSTITNNRPHGISVNDGGSVILSNSILINNVPLYNSFSWDCRAYGGNSIISQGYNILGNIVGCNFIESTGDLIGAPENPIYIRMTALQDNGGPTFTHALMESSPAIDAGNPSTPGNGEVTCLTTDQRGNSRPDGARCDIGAYEGSVPWVHPPANVATYTASNTTNLPGTLLCNQSQPNCTNGSNADADSAHKYTLGIYAFYETHHNRDSIDNNSMAVISTVKYGSNYQNAFWNNTQFVYGNGYPLADDIVAHEYTHGVTQYESSLFYYYQSGAINESFSDVWGEWYDQTNGQGTDTAGVKWQIGEDVSGSGALRSMSNPPAYSDPDKITSSFYVTSSTDNGGVHSNSGINNKAVSLLVDGGSFNGRTVTSLGWEKVGRIYYEVQTNLLSSGADYSDLYYALQQACTNLIGQHGITSGDCIEVKDAIDAVEMNLQPITDFNTDAPLCTYETPVIRYSDDIETGISNWTFTNSSGSTRWQLDSSIGRYAQSGQHSLYADDYPGTVTDTSATWTSFVVPNNAYLHFAHAYGFEYGSGINYYDGGVLEYSINNGSTWIDAGSLMDYNGYDNTILNYIGNNPLEGRQGFVGDSHGYISTRVNLASLAGKTAHFRWRMGLDDSYSNAGWWVDNIRIYTCGPETTFADVPGNHWAHNWIERLYDAGLTGGCTTSPLNYCPTLPVTRAEMAVFLEKGLHGNSFTPPNVPATFGDTAGHWAEDWIEALKADGITGGCGSGNYCPNAPVTRAEMAVFLLRVMHSASYTPPNHAPTFADSAGHWAEDWIEQLALEGITSGCGGGNYCPNSPATREQMAVFLVKAFGLP